MFSYYGSKKMVERHGEVQLRVLSLFDGMGCLGIALKDMGYTFQYYTSEIDKHAIKQSKLNFPDSIQLGDVTKWREWDIDWNFDLIGAGSPCQGFSFAGKQLAFNDPRSALFFTFVEILQHIRIVNPNVKFLLENVKMKKKHELVISKYMNVAPIEINSAFVSAQNRVRLYWTNIYNEPVGLFGDMQCMIPQPKDKGILLKDILKNEVDGKYYLSNKMLDYLNRNSEIQKQKGNGFTFSLTDGNKKGKAVTTKAGQRMEYEFIVHNTMPRSSTTGKGGSGPLSRTDGKTYCLDTGNTNAVEIVAMRGRQDETRTYVQQLEPRTDGKTNCLTSVQKDNLVSKNRKIRRLTPTECARLQTVPSWYQWKCSDTQKYRMLGNGWTIDVIKHILSYGEWP